jgi:hypothetical protein
MRMVAFSAKMSKAINRLRTIIYVKII